MATVHIPDQSKTLDKDDEIRDYLAGNLCRCAAYPEIINAVKSAARKMQARETA